MQADGPGAGLLAAKPDPDGISVGLVEAAPDLHGRGQVGGVVHGPDDPLDQVEVPEAPGAPVALHDLLHRTPEVDVDEVRRVDLGDERRRVGHHRRIGAEDLDADGPLGLVEAEVVPGPLVVHDDPGGADELADEHVGAEPPAEPAERRLAHARLGREVERGPLAPEHLENVGDHGKKLRKAVNP